MTSVAPVPEDTFWVEISRVERLAASRDISVEPLEQLTRRVEAADPEAAHLNLAAQPLPGPDTVPPLTTLRVVAFDAERAGVDLEQFTLTLTALRRNLA